VSALRDWLDAEGHDLALKGTLLLLLLVPVGQWNVRPLVLLLAAAGLVHRGALHSAWLWGALTALAGWRVVDSWPLADNHAYLLAYWCGAILLSRLTPEPGEARAVSARWLIAGAFAFAAGWKLLSPDFLDGTFFRVMLLADPRFEDLARWAGGLTAADLDASRNFLFAPRIGAETTPAMLVESASLRAAAHFLTWITIAAEGAVALLFIAPLRAGVARHAALLAFCAATYAFAPIEGFGWLLLCMGCASVPVNAVRTRAVYVGVYALLVLYAEIDLAAWLVP